MQTLHSSNTHVTIDLSNIHKLSCLSHMLYLSNAHKYPQFTCPTFTRRTHTHAHTLKEHHEFCLCERCAAGVFQHAGISIHRQRFPSVPELIFHRACVCVCVSSERARDRGRASERQTDRQCVVISLSLKPLFLLFYCDLNTSLV